MLIPDYCLYYLGFENSQHVDFRLPCLYYLGFDDGQHVDSLLACIILGTKNGQHAHWDSRMVNMLTVYYFLHDLGCENGQHLDSQLLLVFFGIGECSPC